MTNEITLVAAPTGPAEPRRIAGPRPLSWPSGARWRAWIIGGAAVAGVFLAVYAGCARLEAGRTNHLQIYADFELRLPFVAWRVLPYLSINLLFPFIPLQLEANEMRQLAARLCWASLAGGAFFLLVPAELVYPDRTDAGLFQPLYDVLYKIDTRYDMARSFHVLYCSIIVWAMHRVARPLFRRILEIWLVALVASTVFTHRHHLFDVVLGGLLAFLVVNVPRMRTLRSRITGNAA